jgi:glutamate-1-semialdehyde aminotransferase
MKNKKSLKIKKGIALWNKAKKIIPGGTQLLSKRSEMFLPAHWPSYFKKAKGCEVWDLDGNKYIDMYSMGIGSCILGYADPDVNKAVKKVIDEGSMCTLNSPEEVELAELLLKLHPWAEKVRYARTGGEAMAIAVRIARAKSQKDKVAFCGYHGWHDWYLASNLADDKNLDGQLMPGLEPRGVPRGLKGTSIPFHYNKIEELKKIIAENNDIGVIVLEPLRYKEPENNFLQEARKIADNINAVLIFDEVSSGFRFNVGGVHLKYKVYPDIAVFAKGISNGFPMAAIIGKKEVMESAQDTFISSTYWTERVGPTAALATIKKMIKEKVHGKLEKTGKYLIKKLREIIEKNNIKMEISGLPALMHFSFQYGQKNRTIETLFVQEMLRQGIIASSGIYVSYAFKNEHIDKYLKAVDVVFAILKDAIDKNMVEKLLDGPVGQSGFKRLT